MIENLQDELYQLENKQAKDAKLGATLLWLIVDWGKVSKSKFLGKNPQGHLIITTEWPKTTPLQLVTKE